MRNGMNETMGGGANGSSRGIAIIGLEGAGKTVFLAALAQAMQEHDGYPYLEASGADAVKTRQYVAGLWDVIQSGEWPPSTNAGTWQTLSWTWHSGEGVSHAVWLPDCAGQDIRQIFENGGADEHQKRLAQTIFTSGHVLVLFNLKELIDIHGVPSKNNQRVQVEAAVCLAVRRLTEAGKPFSVLLTQYDAYRELIEQHGGLLPAVRVYSVSLWRELCRCESSLFPVSAVETKDMVKDGSPGRYPAQNAQPDASVMEVARAVNARLARHRIAAGDTAKVDLGGGVEMELVWCPAGSFEMGSPESSFWRGKSGEAGRFKDETRHRVTLTKGFWLGRTEVTQGQWAAVMGYGLKYTFWDRLWDNAFAVGADYPMVRVSWDECVEFCRRLNAKAPGWGRFRLPTEAEWEYACRAGSKGATYAGDMEIKGENNAPVLDAIAWYGGNSSVGYSGRGRETKAWPGKQYPGGKAGYRQVGGKGANAWQLCDMLGNVMEWCGDLYGAYPSADAADPSGAASGERRVTRGGSWNSSAKCCRSACRSGNIPSTRNACTGFRVAMDGSGNAIRN